MSLALRSAVAADAAGNQNEVPPISSAAAPCGAVQPSQSVGQATLYRT